MTFTLGIGKMYHIYNAMYPQSTGTHIGSQTSTHKSHYQELNILVLVSRAELCVRVGGYFENFLNIYNYFNVFKI